MTFPDWKIWDNCKLTVISAPVGTNDKTPNKTNNKSSPDNSRTSEHLGTNPDALPKAIGLMTLPPTFRMWFSPRASITTGN